MLTSRQLDALKEVTHGASAQAANALSRMLTPATVWVDAPVVLQLGRSQSSLLIGGADEPMFAVSFDFEGVIEGQLWWLLPTADAKRLGDRLRHRHSERVDWRSGLVEAANVVASAHLSAFGTALDTPLLPSTPTVLEAPLGQVFPISEEEPSSTVAASRFTAGDLPHYGGWLLLVLDSENCYTALDRLGKA